jgi:hypothetical protein
MVRLFERLTSQEEKMLANYVVLAVVRITRRNVLD